LVVKLFALFRLNVSIKAKRLGFVCRLLAPLAQCVPMFAQRRRYAVPDAVAQTLCVPKTKSGRIGDEVRRGLRVISPLQPAERRENAEHPCSTTYES
jgi:hypothetical protein